MIYSFFYEQFIRVSASVRYSTSNYTVTFSRFRKWKYGVGRGRLESLSPAVCVSEFKSRIARTTKRQRSTRFPIHLSSNELAAFFAVPEVEIWRRSWSAGKFVPGSLCF